MTNMMQDTPKMWIDEEEFQDQYNELDQENQALTVQEEVTPLPSIADQEKMVKESDLTEEHKGMLGQLIEITKVSELLKQVNNEEVKESRNQLLDATCAVFIQTRMQNNMQIEDLKRKVIKRLADNIENMDLELANEVLTNLSQVTNADATNALANTRGGAPINNGGMPGIQLNINNATAEGAQITTQTLNASPQQVADLKNVATLNNSLKAWGNIPGRKQPIQAQIVDSTQK